MDAIKNNESRKDSMFEDQSPSFLYISFFLLTIAFLMIKYQTLTSSIIYPSNSSQKWQYKLGRTTGINIIYLLLVIFSQIALLIFQSNSICGNYDNALQVLAQGGTTWGTIFTMIFVFINFFFSSWKGPFSNTIGYEISSRIFDLEKKEEFLANLLNDPNNVPSNAPKNLINVLKKILIDGDSKSVRQLINGITLDDFTVFINKSISESLVRNPFEKSKSGGNKMKRKSKKGGSPPSSSQQDINQKTPREEQTEPTTTEDTEPITTEDTEPITTEDTEPTTTEDTEPTTIEDTEPSVVDAIANLFRAICLKDIISEFIWLSLAGSLSVLVSYTLLLQQKCSNPKTVKSGKIEEEDVNEDPVIQKTQNEIKKRSALTDKKLREEKESFTMLNDSNNNKKSFNKEFKTENFWLGQPYKSSLELGDYNVNTSKEKRNIENRISEQGLKFLNL